MPATASRQGHSDEWTTRSLLAWMTRAFEGRGIDSPRLCAEILLAHVINCDRMRLYMEADRPATPIERDLLRRLVARALKDEPIQYLVGEAWFFSLPFKVDKRVLIPRPSSETIVEFVLQHARAQPGFEQAALADICTGSGCLAIALLRNLPAARALATDISTDALEVARANAERHRVANRLELKAGNLLEPLKGHPLGHDLHYLVANPPYIPDHEWNTPDLVGVNVRGQEPEIALRGGGDGLDLVGPLIADGPARLRRDGLMLIEIASSTAGTVLYQARSHPEIADARMLNDHEGLPRVLVARRG